MTQGRTKSIIAHVLKLLDAKKAGLSKILLHKFMYFLDVQGVRAGLSFEPYTYGPFSFDLARELESMTFWDEIEESKKGYSIKNLDEIPELPADTQTRIEQLYDTFAEVADNRYDFQTVEIIGTVLYCAQSLKVLGEEVNERSVIKAFKEWKGEKYPEESISKFYSRVEPHLSWVH